MLCRFGPFEGRGLASGPFRGYNHAVSQSKRSVQCTGCISAWPVALLVIPQPFANHNGGMVEFGSDGFLYIGMGDGGSGNDPDNRAQNMNELLGKILRIDVDHPSGSLPYASPPDNPFFGNLAGRDEIYALGLRNPFRFSFDRGTEQLFADDVGQSAREEIDIITRGGNYGWRVFEGTLCTNLDPSLCSSGNFIPPIVEYDHEGGRCSIIGGYVYRGARSTLPLGAYVYGDFCTGWQQRHRERDGVLRSGGQRRPGFSHGHNHCWGADLPGQSGGRDTDQSRPARGE